MEEANNDLKLQVSVMQTNITDLELIIASQEVTINALQSTDNTTNDRLEIVENDIQGKLFIS